MKWRTDKPCADCPFNSSGAGLHLRKSLGRKRWAEITGGLAREEHFTCHKTADETGDGSNLMCAGAIQWQKRRGVSSNLQRVMERMDWIFSKGRAAEPATQESQ